MNPKYCVSLETAKRMKELGFPQETDFYWKKIIYNGDERWELRTEIEADYPTNAWVAAPHVGELGEWLPKQNWIVNQDDFWLVKKWAGNHHSSDGATGKTMVDAMSKMLIYLAENNLLDPRSL